MYIKNVAFAIAVAGFFCAFVPAMPRAQSSKIETQCEDKNWNSGTHSTIEAQIPRGHDVKKIIITVKNINDQKAPGTCPSKVPSPPTGANYDERKCSPETYNDMSVERVQDMDTGRRHQVVAEIKNGDQAPARAITLCVDYQ